MSYILKQEKYFLNAYKNNHHDKRIIIQLARLYFNMSNLDNTNDSINKAYNFLHLSLEFDDLSKEERIELSSLFAIILSLKEMYFAGLAVLNNLIYIDSNNVFLYFAKAVIYSCLIKDQDIYIDKFFYKIDKMLDLSKNDPNFKLQIIADFNFDKIRQNPKTKELFERKLF